MIFTGICLITEDVQRLVSFYTKLLGVQAQGDEIHAEIVVEGAGFAIYNKAAARTDMNLDFPHPGCQSTMSFQVENVDADCERIKGLGLAILNPPRTWPWGARSMQLLDPDGNIVNFVTPGR